MINDNVVVKFLSMLPLKAEEEEAQKCHKFVLEQANQQNARLVNGNTIDAFKAAVQKIVQMRASVLEEEEIDILCEEG